VFEYYKHAAQKHNTVFGGLYYNGHEKDMAKAREWFTKVEQSSAKLAKQYMCR